MKNRKRIPKCVLGIFIIIMLIMNAYGCSGFSEKEVIRLTIWGSEKDQELLVQMVDSFVETYESEADIEITICEESESTCRDTVLFSPEAAADVYFFADDQLASLVEGGALLPVSDNLNEIVEACGGSDSVAVAAASYKGTMYAYPCTASNGYFLYYNSNYYTEEDVQSLETILDIAARNGKKFGIEMTSGWYMYGFYRGAGLDAYINEDGVTNTCNWNSKDGPFTGKAVTERLLEIADHEGFINVTNDEFTDGVKSGKIIAGISGTWNATIVEESFGDGYAACKLPTYMVDGTPVQIHSVAGYKLVGVNPNSSNTLWAQRLAQWLTNEENQLLRFETRGEGPANVIVAQNPKVEESIAISALADQVQYGHLQYVAGSYWDETYKLGNIIVAGNIENRDVQELLDEFVKNVSK